MKYNFGIDEKTALQILADPETRAIWERWKAQMPKEIVDPDPERLDPVDPMADSVWDFGNGGQGEGSHHAADQSAKKPQAGFSIQPRIGSAHHAKVEAAKSKREHRDSVPRHRHIDRSLWTRVARPKTKRLFGTMASSLMGSSTRSGILVPKTLSSDKL
jgi:hypothetical protein